MSPHSSIGSLKVQAPTPSGKRVQIVHCGKQTVALRHVSKLYLHPKNKIGFGLPVGFVFPQAFLTSGIHLRKARSKQLLQLPTLAIQRIKGMARIFWGDAMFTRAMASPGTLTKCDFTHRNS